MDSTKIIRIACAILIAVFLLLFSGPAISADKTVGHLTDFSGTVMVKSQGSWGVKIKTGLPLYSDDKVVTRAGTATVTFTDGAVMELKANSNLLIKEQEEEKGFFRKVKFTQRRLRLLVGKLIFKTGRASKTKTNFETATMVCGLRGTAGTLSIGADGQAYIQFSDGGTSFTIGDLISGVAEDVPAEIANLNPAQVAAFIAAAAADQAQKAAAMAQETAGTPEAQQAQAQAAYTAAQAAEAAAQEVQVQAQIIIENNPDTALVEQAQAASAAAAEAQTAAQDAQQDAVDAGAVPTPLPPPPLLLPPPPPPPVLPVDPEPPIEDVPAASPV